MAWGRGRDQVKDDLGKIIQVKAMEEQVIVRVIILAGVKHLKN